MPLNGAESLVLADYPGPHRPYDLHADRERYSGPYRKLAPQHHSLVRRGRYVGEPDIPHRPYRRQDHDYYIPVRRRGLHRRYSRDGSSYAYDNYSGLSHDLSYQHGSYQPVRPSIIGPQRSIPYGPQRSIPCGPQRSIPYGPKLRLPYHPAPGSYRVPPTFARRRPYSVFSGPLSRRSLARRQRRYPSHRPSRHSHSLRHPTLEGGEWNAYPPSPSPSSRSSGSLSYLDPFEEYDQGDSASGLLTRRPRHSRHGSRNSLGDVTSLFSGLRL